jgi:flagellar biosynthesis protein FlhB
MWIRRELKKTAWNGLRINYWKAFLVTLIIAFLSGGLSSGFSFNSNSKSFDFSKIIDINFFGNHFSLNHSSCHSNYNWNFYRIFCISFLRGI